MVNDFDKLLTQIGTDKEIALACNVAPIAVYRWRKAGSILGKHLAGIIRVSDRNRSGVTADMLITALDKS